jgi:hypothetical protein
MLDGRVLRTKRNGRDEGMEGSSNAKGKVGTSGKACFFFYGVAGERCIAALTEESQSAPRVARVARMEKAKEAKEAKEACKPTRV